MSALLTPKCPRAVGNRRSHSVPAFHRGREVDLQAVAAPVGAVTRPRLSLMKGRCRGFSMPLHSGIEG
jgi:hypothetical protein